MKAVGLVVNTDKQKVLEVAQVMINWFNQRGIEVITTDNDLYNQAVAADVVIVLGGDGTLLQSARNFALFGLPIFGVNFGHLGFLTELEIHDIFPALEKLVQGDFEIEERMMLEAELVRDGQTQQKNIALNDAVIAKGSFARIIRLNAYLNDEYIGIYPGDGIIIATPTGSTGYSLSAGGPLVPPNLEVLLLTPICPHTLNSRPIILNADSKIRIEVGSNTGETMLTLDGQHGIKLQQHDNIIVRRAPYNARFVKLSDRTFFQVLQEKLKTGVKYDV